MNNPDVSRDVVLVVDDSPETLGVLNEALGKAGMTVLVAMDGAQALAIAQRMPPDIILLDALMPHMDGFETCQQLKQMPDLKNIPVIFMTGLSDSDSIVRGLEVGGVDYITKPIRHEELVARMRVHLANARLTTSARTALDSAGQYLCAVDRRARLQWATPQAHSLLDQAGADSDWLAVALPEQLLPWLRLRSSGSGPLTLQAPCLTLLVSYLGEARGDEILLRLASHEKRSEPELLRAALDVTDREAEVLLWIARGKTNREIGQILALSPRTVNKHLEQIFRKLGVENRTSAAAMALRHLTA